MRRLFWLAMGVTIGILAVRKASRAAEQLTPENLAGRAGNVLTDLGHAVNAFVQDIRAGMREREAELREGVGLDGALGAKQEDFR